MSAGAFKPEVGKLYDLTFPARPDYGTVRVKVVAGDEPPPATPCGARTVRIQLVSGEIERSNPYRVIGPGDFTYIAVFVAKWQEVAKP